MHLCSVVWREGEHVGVEFQLEQRSSWWNRHQRASNQLPTREILICNEKLCASRNNFARNKVSIGSKGPKSFSQGPSACGGDSACALKAWSRLIETLLWYLVASNSNLIDDCRNGAIDLGFGAALGYQIWRIKPEYPIAFLVAGAIGIGTLVTSLSGELFDNGLLLLVDVLQALVAGLVGYCGPLVLSRVQAGRS
jgi:hypothetical protein